MINRIFVKYLIQRAILFCIIYKRSTELNEEEVNARWLKKSRKWRILCDFDQGLTDLIVLWQRKGGRKGKIHGSMQNYWRSCPRHSTFKYIGSRNRTIRRNRAYDWKSMIELRDAWFLVHRRSLLFLSHREFQESNIAVQFVLCILFSLRLNVARSTITKFISIRLIDIFITFDHVS